MQWIYFGKPSRKMGQNSKNVSLSNIHCGRNPRTAPISHFYIPFKEGSPGDDFNTLPLSVSSLLTAAPLPVPKDPPTSPFPSSVFSPAATPLVSSLPSAPPTSLLPPAAICTNPTPGPAGLPPVAAPMTSGFGPPVTQFPAASSPPSCAPGPPTGFSVPPTGPPISGFSMTSSYDITKGHAGRAPQTPLMPSYTALPVTGPLASPLSQPVPLSTSTLPSGSSITFPEDHGDPQNIGVHNEASAGGLWGFIKVSSAFLATT
ncbi:PREDICTED: protein PRRC1-like isoform X1 [Thamnophis sirtalis]|uniref:Protein PRRC1-like isoform X1 n=1 Tax=Thamnophis sirtalis TaxID=35019 RepID=A0A6I9Y9F5_9SAUR|nr:PREDICTED: protein PRRC1-like isoform X1 [Thamnophis sirtalis]